MRNPYPGLLPAEEPPESPYCPVCGACGESPCCDPGVCRHFECWYGKAYARDYEEISRDADQYYCALLALGVGDPRSWNREKIESKGFSIDELIKVLNSLQKLYFLGYDARRCIECENETDESGKSMRQYETEADRIYARAGGLIKFFKELRDTYYREVK